MIKKIGLLGKTRVADTLDYSNIDPVSTSVGGGSPKQVDVLPFVELNESFKTPAVSSSNVVDIWPAPEIPKPVESPKLPVNIPVVSVPPVFENSFTLVTPPLFESPKFVEEKKKEPETKYEEYSGFGDGGGQEKMNDKEPPPVELVVDKYAEYAKFGDGGGQEKSGGFDSPNPSSGFSSSNSVPVVNLLFQKGDTKEDIIKKVNDSKVFAEEMEISRKKELERREAERLAYEAEQAKVKAEFEAKEKKKKDNFFDKVGDFAEDIVNASAYVVAAPVNSITGHEFNPSFNTKAGEYIGGGAMVGVDSVHVLGKTFADTITGGYASKLANTVRKDENKESAGNYLESRRKFSGVKGLEQLENFSKTGAAVIGKVVGQKELKESPPVYKSLVEGFQQPNNFLDSSGGGKDELVDTTGKGGNSVDQNLDKIVGLGVSAMAIFLLVK